MRRMLPILAVAAAGLLAAAAAWASYLEGDEAVGRPRPGPPVRVIPRPEPVPVPDNALARVVRRLTVRPGYTYDGLTVFQLEMVNVDDDTEYLSMAQALKRDDLAIREKGSGSVPALQARNRGRRHVLLLAGEIVAGGKQNRVLRHDLLLEPRSRWVELPVLCVEQGRWHGAGEFKSSPSVAMLGVRVGAQTGAGQERIWADVSRYSRELGVDSSTQDLQAVQDSPEMREDVARYRDEFRKHWHRQAVGMVVARWGRIVGADLFCNSDVFLEHRDRLLESYAMDCSLWRRRHARILDGPIVGSDPGEAQRFLRRALRARCEEIGTPGAGRVVDVSGPGIHGTGLVRKGMLLHAALFPRDEPIPLPAGPPVRRPLPEERRRPPMDGRRR